MRAKLKKMLYCSLVMSLVLSSKHLFFFIVLKNKQFYVIKFSYTCFKIIEKLLDCGFNII